MKNQAMQTLRSATRKGALRAMAALPEQYGRYQIRGELGRGGMGIVYDAFDPELDRRVALKVLYRDALDDTEVSDEYSTRFINEMRATSRIFHANLVCILDAGVERVGSELTPYYVMEQINGVSLAEHLEEKGLLARNEGLRIAAAIARGLAAVHEAGLIHRDLKPSNVLLPDVGEPKVADFGLCRCDRIAGPQSDVEQILGSAHYMAPEQVRAGDATPRSDLFALGSIILRMFSGTEPFHASSLDTHMQRILRDEPDGLESLTPDLRDLVQWLMAKDPDQRPESAAVVAESLDALASAPGPATQDGSTAPETRDAGLPPGRSRGHLRLIAGCACAALLLAASWIFAWARNELVELDSRVEDHWQQVENQLMRQRELLPQLSALLDRYVSYEQEGIDRIITALGTAEGGEFKAQSRSASELDRLLMSAVLLGQSSPMLRADAQFRALAYEISGTKNRIAVERGRYNEAVGQFNRRLHQYPWRIVSSDYESELYYEERSSATGLVQDSRNPALGS